MNAALRNGRGDPPHRHRRILRGFTLIELIMVMIILAIMAGLAMPRFAGTLTRDRVEAAARRVAFDLNLAEQRARVGSAPQTVTFDVSAGSYHLVGMADPDHPTASYVVHLGDPPYEVQVVGAVFGTDASITFNAFGLPDSDGVVVLNCAGYRMGVAVDAASGRVSTSVNVVLPVSETPLGGSLP